MTDGKRRAGWEYLVVFFISLLFYGLLAAWTSNGLGLFSKYALEQANLARDIALGNASVIQDSRLFLQPLPVIVESLLVLIPPLSRGVAAPVTFSVLAACLSSVLFLYALRRFGLPLVARWLLLAGWMLNPVVILEAVNGSGMISLMLVYMALFVGLSGWLLRYTWGPLVFLGFSGAVLAVINLNSLVLLILPVIAVVLSALLVRVENYHFSEHAFWLFVTPVAYAVFVRIFFSELIYNAPFYFLRFDRLFPQALPLNWPSLSAAAAGGIFIEVLNWVWIIAPLLIPLTLIYIASAALHVQPGAVVFTGMAWIPLSFSLLAGDLRPLDQPNRYLMLMIPAAVFMVFLLLRTFKKGRVLVSVVLAVLLLAANLLTFWNFYTLPPGSEYQKYLSTWVEQVTPQENPVITAQGTSTVEQSGLKLPAK